MAFAENSRLSTCLVHLQSQYPLPLKCHLKYNHRSRAWRMATCNDITSHVIRYFCNVCDTILKETETPITGIANISQECPACGRSLYETLQVKKAGTMQDQLPVKIQTAYELAAKLTFDIAAFDRLFTLSVGDHVGIIGSRKHAN
ncbi:MAG TPA: hypothetical protein VH621_06315, partial [Nitrososphaera sp.]